MTVQPGASTPVAVRVEERTAVLELNRPPAHLIDEAMAVRLHESLSDLDSRAEVDAIVVTGAGDVFCGGADASAVRASGRAAPFADAVARLFSFLPRSTTPLVAAVNGDALAGGFGLMCACDIVVVAEGARLGTNEAAYGAWPALAQVPAIRRVPEKAALTNALTGEPFSTDQALRLGIVDEVVPRAQLDARARDWAAAVTAAGSAVATGRPLFYRARELSYEQAVEEARRALTRAFSPPAA
ncbi:enoyl-CoA hydratase/isomerase family protein [Streptomyces sp. 900105755]